MKTSPGCVRPANFWRTRAMASGMEPRCRGSVSPWAMSRPSASQSAQDMSMAFLRLFEYAVRTSAMAISSTMVSSAFLISSCRMGSLSSRVANLSSRVDHDVAVGVEVGEAVGQHQRGGVVFIDEQRAGPRPRVEILAPDDRRADHAVAGTEVGLALAAPGPLA